MSSSSTTLVKLVFCLGIIFLVVGALYPGSEASWTGFSNAIKTGPTFPTFSDPFAANFIAVETFPENNNTTSSAGAWPSSASIVGCDPNTYWKCVRTDDAGSSYIIMNGSGTSLFRLRMTNLTTYLAREVVGVNVKTQCLMNSTGGDPTVPQLRFKGFNTSGASNRLDMIIPLYQCREPGTTWASSTFHWSNFVPLPSDTPFTFWQYGPGVTDWVEVLLLGNWRMSISFFEFDFIVSASTQCGTIGNWWDLGNNVQAYACQIGRFFDGVIKGFLYIVNGVVFVARVIIAIFVYIGGVVLNLFVGLFGTLAFFFSIPDAPATVQGIITALTIAIITWIMFTLINLFRVGGTA